jgi:hypothetical protein
MPISREKLRRIGWRDQEPGIRNQVSGTGLKRQHSWALIPGS